MRVSFLLIEKLAIKNAAIIVALPALSLALFTISFINTKENFPKKKIVEFETNTATYPLIGQQITLPLLKGNKVSAKVESIQVHPNGDYSLRGHINGYGTDYPITMTYGEQQIFATITTPEGSYSMEALNGLGWLYKNPAEPELITPGNNDFIEPPKNWFRSL